MSDNSPPTANEPNSTVYSPAVLGWVYTPYVIGISHRLAWGVRNADLRRPYRLAGPVHLCVGPGNGHFLRSLPARTRTLHLLDLNRSCITHTARRLRRRGLDLRAHLQDAAAPWSGVGDASVDSIDCQMVLHCLRGAGLGDKEAVLAEAARVLKPGGVFFGATVLASGGGVVHTRLGARLMAAYNGARNTFHNAGDSAQDLRALLEKHFERVELRVQGSTGLWQVSAR